MNENFYKTVINESPIAYAYHKIILDAEGLPCDYRFLEVNSAFECFTGLKAADILGKTISEIIPGIGSNEFNWIQIYGQVAISGKPAEFEQYSGGLNHWYRIKAYSPEKYYFITCFSDISFETKQQLALLNFFTISPDLLCIADKQGQFLRVNDAWEKTLGYSETMLRGTSYTSYIHPDDRRETVSAMQRLESQKKVVQFVNRFRNDCGEYRYIEWCASLEEETAYIAGRDITEKMEEDGKVKRLLTEMETIFNATQDGLFMLRVDGEDYTYIKNNVAYEKLTGRHIQGKTPEDLWGKELAKKVVANYNRCLKAKKAITYEEILPLPKGERIVFTTLTPILEDGKPVFIVGCRRDVTEEKKSAAMLFEEKERLRVTLLSVGDGVIATDATGNITIMNTIAEKLTGWNQKEAENSKFSDVFNIMNEYTREKCQNPIQKVMDTGKVVGLANHTILISKDGNERPIADSAAPIIHENGEVKGVILVFRDVTVERHKQAMIEHLSFHDQLTDLYNRRFFDDEIHRLDTPRNLPLSIIMADVNGLKLTNDAFGHHVGDMLLMKAADTIQLCCRRDDMIARLGGDEFVILLPRTGKKEAEGVVQKIVEQCSFIKVDAVSLSISCGWSVKTGAEEKIYDVLKKAEDMMYRRKLFEGPSIRGQIIEAVVKALYEANCREKEHSERVSMICEKMGHALGYSERVIQELRTAGLLHDIGKVAIDVSIIDKPGPLTENEWIEIKRHPEIGYRILSAVNDMSEIAQSVLSHHERWDGTGYPRGISGEAIPIYARILSIADAYDAMTCERPYRKPMAIKQVEDEMLLNRGRQFDTMLVQTFLSEVAPVLR